MDVRGRWVGLKRLRAEYTPQPHAYKKTDGAPVPLHERGEEAAKHLATKQWGAPTRPTGQRQHDVAPMPRRDPVVDRPLAWDLSPLTLTELRAILKKFKRRKAPGPDEVPMEFFKEMDDDTLAFVMGTLNDWWARRHIPEEALKARVVFLYKKGDSSNLNNYRPISLLNSIYKIFAAFIQRRLSYMLARHLQRTQYGFRQRKSTAQAIHLVRRAMEYGERTGNNLLLLLLDWEKAFDKVKHEALFQSLERMQVHPQILDTTRPLYSKPTFFVEIEGSSSQMHEQVTGIRQGCPLSPYLFLVVMTCLFHDVHAHHSLDNDLRAGRVPGQTEDELLYADDTICVSTSKAALEKLLHAIETESEKYGLKLNETKCEVIQFGRHVTFKFRHGTVVPHMHKVIWDVWLTTEETHKWSYDIASRYAWAYGKSLACCSRAPTAPSA